MRKLPEKKKELVIPFQCGNFKLTLEHNYGHAGLKHEVQQNKITQERECEIK
jgi:hypothetical protein